MKYFTFFLIFFLSPPAFALSTDGCSMSSAEKLVCAVLLCNPLGMSIAESRPECLKINIKYAIYLTTLPPWDKPAKCYARDESCRKTGRASNAQISPEYCIEVGDINKQNACIEALRVTKEGYCTQFQEGEKKACDSIQETGQLNEDYCKELAEKERWGEWRFLSSEELAESRTKLEKCEQLYQF